MPREKLPTLCKSTNTSPSVPSGNALIVTCTLPTCVFLEVYDVESWGDFTFKNPVPLQSVHMALTESGYGTIANRLHSGGKSKSITPVPLHVEHIGLALVLSAQVR
jgi:hypothetical protein